MCQAASALPGLVQQALAHVLEYLKAFGQQTVLRLGSRFQRMQSHMEMALSPNTLQSAPAGASEVVVVMAAVQPTATRCHTCELCTVDWGSDMTLDASRQVL